MRILLARHAKPVVLLEEGRYRSLGLSEEGKTQAEKLSARLKRMNVKLIFSGSAQKIKETAEIIGEQLSLEIHFQPLLEPENQSSTEALVKKTRKAISEIIRTAKELKIQPAEYILIIARTETIWVLLSLTAKCPLSTIMARKIDYCSLYNFSLDLEDMA